MAHKIAEAVLEKGQIKSINRKLPQRRMKVHLIYDVGEGKASELNVRKVIQGTSGIYRDVDVEAESKRLRAEWERNARN